MLSPGLLSIIAFVCIFALAMGGAIAGDATPIKPDAPDWKAAIEKKLERKISFDFYGTPVDEVVQFAGSLLRVNIFLEKPAVAKITTPITLKVADMPASEALKKTFALAGMEYELVDEAIFVTVKQKNVPRKLAADNAETANRHMPDWELELRKRTQRKISFCFVDTPLDEAMGFFSRIVNVPLILDFHIPKDEMAATLRVEDLSLEVALRWIVRMGKLEMKYFDHAIFIFPKGRYEIRPVAPLNALQAESLQKAVADFRSPDFETREQASLAVQDLGAGAIKTLKERSKSEADPEARSRILHAIDDIPDATIFEESPEATHFLNELSRRLPPISIDFEDSPLSKAAEFMAEKLKIKIAVPTGSPPFTLRLQDFDAGYALRWVARMNGCRIVVRGENVELVKLSNSPAPKE